MNNEKGFILPLSMVLLFLLSSSLFHQIAVYEREKRFQMEQEQYAVIQTLLQMATVDLLTLVANGGQTLSGYFEYEQGKVYYWQTDEMDQFVYIDFNIITNAERQRYVRIGIDKENLVVIDWRE